MELYDTIKKYGLIGLSALGPNSHTYYVDTNHANALDADDGEHGQTWEKPFAKITYAIARNNAEGDAYNQSTIYVASGTYIEDFTTYPKNCNIIGVGSKCRITGNHTDAQQNVRWFNFEFRPGSTVGAVYTAKNATHGLEFHQCRFKNTSSKATIAIDIENGADGVIEDCWIGGNNLIGIGIRFNTGGNQNWKVINNTICVSDVGVQINGSSASYQNLIKGNHITAQNPNDGGQQLLIGIDETPTGLHCGFEIVDNTISAVNAIHFGLVDTYSQFTCTKNRINEGGSSAWEDA